MPSREHNNNRWWISFWSLPEKSKIDNFYLLEGNPPADAAAAFIYYLLRPWCDLATQLLRRILKLRSRNKDCTGESTACDESLRLIMGKIW